MLYTCEFFANCRLIGTCYNVEGEQFRSLLHALRRIVMNDGEYFTYHII
jgi:hypothetical protein